MTLTLISMMHFPTAAYSEMVASAAGSESTNTHFDAPLSFNPEPLATVGAAVDESRLGESRGAADVRSIIESDGVVSDNTATNVVTGSNAINDGSFAGASGLATVIQNTGANVLIQNATIVNVEFK
jgi:beta-lactamase class A